MLRRHSRTGNHRSRGVAAAVGAALAVVSVLPVSPVLLAAPATASPGAPRALNWADLVPPAPPGRPNLKSFLANRPRAGGIGMTDHSTIPEGRWLAPGGIAQEGAGEPPAVVEELDGQRIRIGGYVVPLDFDATRVREFLLVPFVGACIHVPPPPPNQLVYVTSEAGIEVKGLFDPVWVTGVLQTKVAFTGLAEAGYSIEAEAIDTRAQ